MVGSGDLHGVDVLAIHEFPKVPVGSAVLAVVELVHRLLGLVPLGFMHVAYGQDLDLRVSAERPQVAHPLNPQADAPQHHPVRGVTMPALPKADEGTIAGSPRTPANAADCFRNCRRLTGRSLVCRLAGTRWLLSLRKPKQRDQALCSDMFSFIAFGVLMECDDSFPGKWNGCYCAVCVSPQFIGWATGVKIRSRMSKSNPTPFRDTP